MFPFVKSVFFSFYHKIGLFSILSCPFWVKTKQSEPKVQIVGSIISVVGKSTVEIMEPFLV